MTAEKAVSLTSGDKTVTGNVSCTGNITMGTNNSYPDLRLGSTNGNNIGIATTATSFSNSSAVNDMVIRSLNRLILQSGGAGHAILIDSSNNVSCAGALNVSGTTTFNNSSTNFWYNTPGTSFINNGFTSFLSLNSNVITNMGTASQPFIRVYNRM